MIGSHIVIYLYIHEVSNAIVNRLGILSLYSKLDSAHALAVVTCIPR